MKQSFESVVESCTGKLCEVQTLGNRLLFAGRVRRYNMVMDELIVDLYRGEETPSGVLYHTPVKLLLRMGDGLITLFGLVTKAAPQFWCIELGRMVSHVERRESFRQRLTGEAVLERIVEEDEDADATVTKENEGPIPCKLLDISLTGLAFTARADFHVGEKLVISSLKLLKEGTTFNFHATIRRHLPQEYETTWRGYGCSFDSLTSNEKDVLFKELFMLQARDLNAK